MFKKVAISIIVLLIASFVGFSQTTDLFISEYVEGSGNNKYIEIYNGTGASVNLADYRLRLYANGALVGAPTNDVLLSGTLANNSVIVYKNSLAAIYGGTATANAAVNFNGDDAVALFKISTASFVDIFGNIGCDPGTNWTNTNTTLDKTLIRNSNVCSGISTDDGTSCPFPTLVSEWTQFNIDDVSNLGSHSVLCCTPVTEPSSNASAYAFSIIGCNGFTIDWTSPVANDGSLVVIKSSGDVTADPVDGIIYTANSTFGSGTDIGTSEYVVYNGNGTSVIVTGLSASTSYYVNVFEYNGLSSCIDYRTSDELSSFTTTVSCDTCAYLAAALINSCDNLPCTEGDNEMLFLNSGNYYVNTNAAGITVNYGSTSPAPNTYADSFTANPNAIDSMNSDAGCAGVFIDASTINTIPANSTFLILNETVCADAFNWSSMCSAISGNVYVFFSSDVTWTSAGQFSNSPPASGRFFRTILEGCTIDYSYDSLNFPSGDGAIAYWNNTGGLATSYGTNGCTIPPTVLPIELTSFSGKSIGTTNLLEWTTSTEINNNFFTIERAEDAIHFNPLGIVDGAKNSNIQLYYNFVDDSPTTGINYYRLKQTDFNGNYAYSSTIAINNVLNDFTIYVNNNILYINLSSVDFIGNITIYDITGRKIIESPINSNLIIDLSPFKKGIYIYQLISGNNSTSSKFILR